MNKIVQELMSHMPPCESMEMQQQQVQANAQESLKHQGSLALKNQGNQLHGMGKYSEAVKKYHSAKEKLSTLRTPEALALKQACSLNLMACYLKMGEFEKTIAEGIEVLKTDVSNLKALFRRGQAYKALGKLRLAFDDLSKAAQIAPGDETVVNTWRQLQDQLGIEAEVQVPPEQNEAETEEIVASDTPRLSFSTSSSEQQRTKLPDTTQVSQTSGIPPQHPASCSRRKQSVAAKNLEPEQVVPVNGCQITPELIKMAPGSCNEDSISGFIARSSGNPNSSPETEERLKMMMMNSMVQNMTPECMAAATQQRDVKLSQEDSKKANPVLTAEDLERMMLWVNRAHRTAESIRRGKAYLLRKPGLILAIALLILTLVLQWWDSAKKVMERLVCR